MLNDSRIIFRVAKITPTKIGQFVTLWKRTNEGPIKPYDDCDELDLLVVNTEKDKNFEQFIFLKSVLLEQGILSKNNRGGKRAIRVYPPLDQVANKQARQSQKWQLVYFLPISQKSIFNNRYKRL